jgi:hypothetical protein
MVRVVTNPDYLQSVPKKSRAKAREASKHMRVSADAPTPAKAPLVSRTHWARVIGAATLASLVSVALFASPGENPAYHTRVSTNEKPLAKGLNKAQNPIHGLANGATQKRTRKSKNDAR